jgi:hypothetical protein
MVLTQVLFDTLVNEVNKQEFSNVYTIRRELLTDIGKHIQFMFKK